MMFLQGARGADWLDGGKGKDVLSGEGLTDDGTGALTDNEYARGGPNGADTFVTRDGDGGPSVDLADVIMDFEDGSDLIGLKGLNYGQLTITQGQDDYVNDVIVRILSTGEYLFVIKNQQLVNIDYFDFVSTSTDSIILPGTSNNDVLLGGSGGDTVTTGSGTDVVVAYGGDDTITIDGAGNKTVDGGTGDRLVGDQLHGYYGF